MEYTCAIIEEAPLSEAILRKYIGQTGFLELSWECSSVADAITKDRVDLLFLEMLSNNSQKDASFNQLIKVHTCVILTSVYPKESWNFPANVVAFLTKPFSFTSYMEAIEAFIETMDRQSYGSGLPS
uniref:Response regulator n=1 Tax=Roseihalotalea indica TaxID=2867963 RepID=A0AA49JIA4_9BACT|nr:hypothetical protein K4G66_16755 [Tunicatimonas sp. TK19036]